MQKPFPVHYKSVVWRASSSAVLAVQEDEASNPIEVGLFRADALAPAPDAVADLIEQGQARGGNLP